MIDTSILRKKIIDLAVTGALTEHSHGNANDELREIIERLNNEEQRPILDDEKWANIPSNWVWCRLTDLTTSSSLNDGDWVLSKDMVPEGEVKLIQLGSIGDCEYRLKGFKFLTEKHFKELNGKQIFPGYLLINRLVVDKMLSCIIPNIQGILMTAVDVCWVAPNDELYNINYLMYVLSSSGVQQKVQELGHGVTRFRISKLNLVDIAFPLPPLEEQQLIVEKIESLSSLIKTIDELQDQYAVDKEVLKSKIIDAGIQGRVTHKLPTDGSSEALFKEIIRDKDRILKLRKGRKDKIIKEIDDDTPFDIPEHWKWIRFGDVGLFKKGPFGSALTKSMFVPKGEDTVKVYEQQHAIRKDANLGTYYITKEYFDEKMNGFEVKPGDIIVSCAGTIGETYILPEKIEQGIINQALMRITLVDGIDRRFFLYYFDSNLKKNAQEQSNGSAIKNIPPFDVMKNWYFPLPPKEEQGRIADRIDELLQYC